MTPKLAALLVSIGAVGSILIMVPQFGVTEADLLDAGVGECEHVGMLCPVLLTTWPDAGGYKRMLLDGRLCDADSGTPFFLTQSYWDIQVVDWESCTVVADAGEIPRMLEGECACRKPGAPCNYQSSGGAWEAAPTKRTLGPGYPPYELFEGEGCISKGCREIAGFSSWPTDCGPE